MEGLSESEIIRLQVEGAVEYNLHGVQGKHNCPYPRNSLKERHWMQGFRDEVKHQRERALERTTSTPRENLCQN